MRIAGEDINIQMTLLVFAVGLAGGLFAKFTGLPLPMLLGSVVAVGAISILGFEPGGAPPKVPAWLRLGFIPVIGLSIGAAFTPDVLREAKGWLPSLLSLVLFVPIAHYASYNFYRRVGGLPAPTAYFSAMPGGFIEAIQMGEEHGADGGLLAALQFLRLILTIILVPLAFAALSGGAVGSAAGVMMPGGKGLLDAPEVLGQAAAAIAGFLLGRKLHFPAAALTGPLLIAGLGHLAGVLESSPPRWLIDLTQLIVGTALGTRFVGMVPRTFLRMLWLALLNILLMISLAVGAALILHAAVDERIEAVVLAFAPGGLAEMSLVALSLHLSVLYVTAHHILRIMLAVTVARIFVSHLPRD